MSNEEWAYGIIHELNEFTDAEPPERYEVFWPDKPDEASDGEVKRE